MIKHLLIGLGCAALITTSAVAAPMTKTAMPSVAVTSPVPPVGDVLDKEIGSRNVLKLTMKTGETQYVTIQGRTDTEIIAAKVHFATKWYIVSQGFGNWKEPRDMSASQAIDLLETNPRQFRVEGVHPYSVYPDDKLTVSPSAITRIELLKLPDLTPPPPKIAPRPARINPSLSALWP